jgi:CBS domain-containing membrane protein
MAEFFSSVILQSANSPLIIASTGASAMLMFGSPHALVSRPWKKWVSDDCSYLCKGLF